MNRFSLPLLVFIAFGLITPPDLFAQSAAVTFPTPGFAFADGTLSTTLTSTCTTCPSSVGGSAQYMMDEQELAPVWTAPFSSPWNPYYSYNGPSHQVYVIYRNALGATIATSPKITFSVGNTWPVDPINTTTVACTSMTPTTPYASPWAGTVTLNGVLGGTAVASVATQFYVDSWSVGSKNGATPSQPINTARFTNGFHNVLAVTRNNTLGAAAQACQFGPVKVDFENGAVTSDLSVTPSETYLAPGNTLQLTPTILKTDQTKTSTVGTITWGPVSDSSLCTVSASGLVTALNPGYSGICSVPVTTSLISDPISTAPTSYIYIYPTNTIAHYGADGLRYDTFQPGNSTWEAGGFFGQTLFNDQSKYPLAWLQSSVPQITALLLQAGVNTLDVDGSTLALPSGATLGAMSQSTFANTINAQRDVIKGWLDPAGSPVWPIRVHGVLTGIFNNTENFYPWLYQNPSTWTPHGFTILGQAYPGFQVSTDDEITAIYHSNPIPNGTIAPIGSCSSAYGVDCLTSITCDGAGHGVVAWSSPFPQGGNSDFAIFGSATHPALNSTPGGSYYVFTSVDGNHFGWTDSASKCTGGGVCPTTACSTAYTVDSTTDPLIHVEPYIDPWTNSNTDYVRYNFWTLMHNDFLAAPTAIASPPKAGSSALANYKFMGDPASGEGGEFYFNNSNQFVFYTPTHAAISYLLNDNGRNARTTYNQLRGIRPFLSSTNFTSFAWGVQGTPMTLTSITGPNVTMSAPHGIPNIVPGGTRGTIFGANSPDGYYGTGGTDLASSNGTTAAGCTVTSASHTFLSTEVGRQLQITGGTNWLTTPIRVITGVSAGAATLDLPCASVASVSAGSWQLGVDVYIEASPTASTFRITPRKPIDQGGVSLTCSSNCGTVTFSNGDTYTANNFSSCATCGDAANPMPRLQFTAASNAIKVLHVGMTFVVNNNMTGGNGGTAGQANTYYNCVASAVPGVCDAGAGHTFYLIIESQTNPAQANYGITYWREVPLATHTATGGTFNVISDFNVQYGRNQISNIQPNPEVRYLSDLETALVGGAGVRHYGFSSLSNYVNGLSAQPPGGFPTWFRNTNTGGGNIGQAQFGPVYFNTPSSQQGWNAGASASVLLRRFAENNYLYGGRCAAPDLGFSFDVSCRTGTSGNSILITNVSDAALTRDVDISACAVSGQSTIRYTGTWNNLKIATISAGVTTDTGAVFPPASSVFYLCSNNAAYEYSPPVIGVRLADHAGATKIGIRYGYQPFLLKQTTDNVVDCNTGSCVLPVDLKIGPAQYQILYLASNGSVIAEGPTQSMHR